MPGQGFFLLHFCILGYIFGNSVAWHVNMPRHIKGLLGSCLVIPCSFSYYQYPPQRPGRVVWYQYVSNGYPLVHDNWYPNDVIAKFKGKTQVFASEYSKTCSLKIQPVTWSHHREKIYPWVDPENVGRSTYRFFETTVTIEVVDRPNKPDIVIFGEMKVGKSVTVQCSVYHTCSTDPPTLGLNIPLKNHHLAHSSLPDGTSKLSLTTAMVIERDQQTVRCSVRHTGGQTAEASYTLNAECSILPLTISSPSNEFLEGYARDVTCTASYTCEKHTPILTWNYGRMPSSTRTTRMSTSAGWRTISTLAFKSSAEDHGRSLTCYARFLGGQSQQTSIALRVKRNMHSSGWSFTTPGSITGMRGSCIIVPCRFSYSVPQPPGLQVIWYLYQRGATAYPVVFNQRERALGKFNGKTSLIGSVGENNCSLKIERLEMSHNQDRLYPWIDKNPITSYHNLDHSFFDKTTQLVVSDQAPDPEMSIIGVPRVGERSTVSCSVRHTCLPSPPILTLSGITGTDLVRDTLVSDGIWERTVERTWTVEEKDQSVKCTVSYRAGQKASKQLPLNVECPYYEITMDEGPRDVLDGMAKSVICSVSFKCEKNTPTVIWNYKDMQSSLSTKKISSNSFSTVSNLTFIGSVGDNGKSLTCTAKFLKGETSASATILIKRNMLFRGWFSTTPRRMSGMKGSCIIIPCRFSYSIPQPPKLQVIWYMSQRGGYPAIFHQRQNSVGGKFVGITSLIGSVGENNCSLRIERLETSHNQVQLYPWIDEYPVTSYHTVSDSFSDEITQLNVLDEAQEPEMSITGVPRVGEESKVSCSVRHTCISSPPILTLSGITGTDHILDTLVSDGIWERTVERTWTVEEDDHNIECTVSYRAGQKASKQLPLNVECPYNEITMVERPDNVPEGVPKSVVCSVSYKCKKNIPTITWNYKNMQLSSYTKKINSNSFSTVSNLTFIGSVDDDGKSLNCTAQFAKGETSASATIHIKRNMFSSGWSFTTPGHITGMKGSCIIIPCMFSYSIAQPPDLQVIWYLYQRGTTAYPVVFNQSGNALGKFNGKTSLIGSVGENNCSLKIERLETSHNQDQLYPWIDKKSITSYHTNDNSLLGKTTQLLVLEQARDPEMSIIGVPRVGEQGKVSCSVRHTCLSSPPILTLSGITGTDTQRDTLVSDGIWERTVERTWTVEEDDHNIECTVSYPAGQKASKQLPLNVECPYNEIIMQDQPNELKEGIAKIVTCSVSYKCKRDTPTIVWNYRDMQSSSSTKKISRDSYNTASNLTLIASVGDDGKSLSCTAQFLKGETSASATIRLRTAIVLAADVPTRFSALTRSCVVIPCSFQDNDEPMTRGIWSKKTGGIVFHNGQSNVLDHFKGRTRLLGDLNEGNCTMEIDDIKPFDNGPFCFHAEKGDDKYTFNKSCVFLQMKASPEKPTMTEVPAEVDAGSTLTVSCSVSHTCPSHPPVFSWSVPHLTMKVSHTPTSQGFWETTSTITFMVAAGDGIQNLNCTATFWRDKQQANSVNLNVKGSLLYQFQSSAPMAFPVSFLVLIIIVLAAVFGVCIWRKRSRKLAGDPLSPPPRPEKRRSMWDRLSRRYPEEGRKPPRPEKRKSVWSRLSRNWNDRVGWENRTQNRTSIWSRFSRRRDDATNLSVGYVHRREIQPPSSENHKMLGNL